MLSATILQQTTVGEWPITLILALVSVIAASGLALAVSIRLARRIRMISNQGREHANDDESNDADPPAQ